METIRQPIIRVDTVKIEKRIGFAKHAILVIQFVALERQCDGFLE